MDKWQNSFANRRFIESLYEEHRLLLLNTIRRYVGVSEDCEDIFHEVFIRIIENADNLIQFPANKLKAYILLIAYGVSIDYLRRKYRNPEICIDDDILFNTVCKTDKKQDVYDPFNKVDLSLILDTIPQEQRVLLIGKYYLGLSGEELACLVGGSSVAVRSQLHRAKKKVLEEWKKAGLCLEDFY